MSTKYVKFKDRIGNILIPKEIKEILENLKNMKQVIYCQKKSDFVTSQNYNNINDWQEVTKVGDAFSIKNGVVNIGSNVNRVKVTLKYRYIGKTSGEMLFSYLIKSNKNINTSWSINTVNTNDITFLNETIVDVKEGDTITSSIYAGGGTLKADATVLIVEKID